MVIPIFNEALAPAGSAPAVGEERWDALTVVDRFIDLDAWAAALGRPAGAGRGVVVIPLVLLVLFVFRGITLYVSAYYIMDVSLRMVQDLRRDLYESIQRQSLRFFAHHPTGLLISRVTSDVDRIKVTLSRQLEDAFRLVFTLIAIVAYVFYLDWRLASVCLVIVPVVAFPVVRFGRRLKRASRQSQERMADVANLLHETITGTRIVKGFSMEAFEISRFREALKRLFRFDLKAARNIAILPPLLELIGAVAGALLLWHAGKEIAAGTLDRGAFLAFLAGVGVVYANIKKLSKIYNDIVQAMAAARRVFEVLDTEPDVVEAPAAVPLAPFKREVRFDRVTFAYDGAPVLSDLDLTVRAGEVVALVGPSGSGKTTLVNLLPRFYDATSGRVTLDGVDVRDATFDSLRGQIALVTQEIILFNETVAANIAYGRPEVPIERIRAAARAAFAEEFIDALPEKYQTVLGERGQRLSIGQRQRISIARALLKDAPILILDEATSALDTESEAIVQRALGNLLQGRTALVIAHRLSTVRSADRIVVLERGRIVDEGTHDQLLARGGLYAQLHRAQAFHDGAAAPAPGAA
jgi:subfamily B ATP-binding cassette protein MsbA